MIENSICSVKTNVIYHSGAHVLIPREPEVQFLDLWDVISKSKEFLGFVQYVLEMAKVGAPGQV
jgi:hypothetical protein